MLRNFFFNIALCNSLHVSTINFPFDRGSNQRGSDYSPEVIHRSLNFLNPVANITIASSKREHLRTVLSDGYFKTRDIVERGIFPVIIGGDHTISASTISACNDVAIINQERLGVLWFSAFADFNTIQTSTTGNLHGTTVSILCKHTLPMLSLGHGLEPEQFGFIGLRDLDSCEFNRFTEYNMRIIDSDNENDLHEWLKMFDQVYISISLDVLDPLEFNLVNCPVPDGVSSATLINIIKQIKSIKKIMALDIVEFNPLKGENTSIIIDIIKSAITPNL